MYIRRTYKFSSVAFAALLLTMTAWFVNNKDKNNYVVPTCPMIQVREACLEYGSALYLRELGKRKKEIAEYERRLKAFERKIQQQFPEKMSRISELLSLQLPVIYAITPTYARPVQKAELTRLMNTFINVPNFHWIVIEDATDKSDLVGKLLKRSGLKYTHLNQPTPSEYKLKPEDPNWLKPRGLLQRNKGLSWLRQNVDRNKTNGVVYFADDDNTYDLQLFEEMRFTKKVSVWPVGFAGYLRYEQPVIKNGKVIGWFTYWKPERKFAIDMAGFAVNIKLFFDNPNAEFDGLHRGQMESYLLSSLGITLDDLEPKADNCTKILVWHTRTEKPNLTNESKLLAAGKPGTDPKIEV